MIFGRPGALGEAAKRPPPQRPGRSLASLRGEGESLITAPIHEEKAAALAEHVVPMSRARTDDVPDHLDDRLKKHRFSDGRPL